MGKYALLGCYLIFNGCAYVHFSADVEGVGSIDKRIVAIGNAELQQVAQKLEGRLYKDGTIIQFGSESSTQAVTKEEALAFLGKIATLL